MKGPNKPLIIFLIGAAISGIIALFIRLFGGKTG